MIREALGLGPSAAARALVRAAGPSRAKVAALSEPLQRALEAAGHQAISTAPDGAHLPLDDGAVDAICLEGLGETPEALLRESARVVRDRGRILVATPAGLTRRGLDRAQVSALLLAAGLVDLEQKVVRGTVISTGRVRR